jgi:hypothetical protein
VGLKTELHIDNNLYAILLKEVGKLKKRNKLTKKNEDLNSIIINN